MERNTTLWDFCVSMVGRDDIEGSKRNFSLATITPHKYLKSILPTETMTPEMQQNIELCTITRHFAFKPKHVAWIRQVLTSKSTEFLDETPSSAWCLLCFENFHEISVLLAFSSCADPVAGSHRTPIYRPSSSYFTSKSGRAISLFSESPFRRQTFKKRQNTAKDDEHLFNC